MSLFGSNFRSIESDLSTDSVYLELDYWECRWHGLKTKKAGVIITSFAQNVASLMAQEGAKKDELQQELCEWHL